MLYLKIYLHLYPIKESSFKVIFIFAYQIFSYKPNLFIFSEKNIFCELSILSLQENIFVFNQNILVFNHFHSIFFLQKMYLFSIKKHALNEISSLNCFPLSHMVFHLLVKQRKTTDHFSTMYEIQCNLGSIQRRILDCCNIYDGPLCDNS